MSGDDADVKAGSTGEDAISDRRLDRALRTLLARDAARVDLRARVMAAIDAPVTPRARPPWRVAAAAACFASVLLVAALAMWSGERDLARETARQARTEAAHDRAAHHVVPPRATEARAVDAGPAEDAVARGPVRRAKTPTSRAGDRNGNRWDAALPPLEPPPPLAVEQMDAPPVQVAQLRIERLSIDPLEVDPLDRSREE